MQNQQAMLIHRALHDGALSIDIDGETLQVHHAENGERCFIWEDKIFRKRNSTTPPTTDVIKCGEDWKKIVG